MGGHQTLLETGNISHTFHSKWAPVCTSNADVPTSINDSCEFSYDTRLSRVLICVPGDKADVCAGVGLGRAGKPLWTDPRSVGGSGGFLLRALSGETTVQPI
jgi:hypothetical protein